MSKVRIEPPAERYYRIWIWLEKVGFGFIYLGAMSLGVWLLWQLAGLVTGASFGTLLGWFWVSWVWVAAGVVVWGLAQGFWGLAEEVRKKVQRGRG